VPQHKKLKRLYKILISGERGQRARPTAVLDTGKYPMQHVAGVGKSSMIQNKTQFCHIHIIGL
jgi:hypothetical protein